MVSKKASAAALTNVAFQTVGGTFAQIIAERNGGGVTMDLNVVTMRKATGAAGVLRWR